jgi:hypothetical protein
VSNLIPEGLAVHTVRQKPMNVQAVTVTQENLPLVVQWIEDNGHHAVLGNDQLIIQTMEGPFTVRIGDTVMRGIEGEFSRCDPSIYEKSYDVLGLAVGENA